MPLQETPPGAVTQIDGREVLYFVGTGYLGIQGRPEVIEAAIEGARRYGIGSANSRTAFGTTPPLLEVERLAAALFGLDDAFYFASGWMGNSILLHAFDAKVGQIFIDECSHYSIAEAARLAGRPPITFHHRDAEDLRSKLSEHLKPGRAPWVLSDGVFAATGHIAPADRYYEVLQPYPGSTLCLDDAHGIAVLGENGRGTFEHVGLWHLSPRPLSGEGPGVRAVASPRPLGEGPGVRAAESRTLPSPLASPNSALPCPALLFCGTMSKAVGGYGGIIPGGREFMQQLKSRSPYMGGASAPPTPIAAATARALELILAEPALRSRLRSNVRLLKAGLRRMGFDVDDTPVPIVCLQFGTAHQMQRIQQELMARGIAIAYMAAYSGLGPEGALRLAVFATHTEEMIARLLDALRQVV
jgi:7-keto-8-aminopelargonate synthetase-like enzyme